MKNIFTLLFSVFSFLSNAQVLCGTADENGTITLTAPAGNVFTSIEFASYGTPNGVCGSFTIGTCDAANSTSIVSAALIGMNSGSIDADNATFGDPCGGTPKRLYIQATYSTILPLTLISFTATRIEPASIKLDWSSENEINSSSFVIERSTDGVLMEPVGSIPAAGSGRHNYSFTTSISNMVPIYYYRLKMVDGDGRSRYSSIVRVNNRLTDAKLTVYPSPASESITITSSGQKEIMITNTTGQLMKKIILINGSQTVELSGWNPGVYFIKTEKGVWKFIKL